MLYLMVFTTIATVWTGYRPALVWLFIQVAALISHRQGDTIIGLDSPLRCKAGTPPEQVSSVGVLCTHTLLHARCQRCLFTSG